jgi:serine protease Do
MREFLHLQLVRRLGPFIAAAILLCVRDAAAADVTPAGIGVTSATIQALVHDVGRSVVQVIVSGYRPTDGDGPGVVVAHARTIGSGVAIADGGYVVTNAHVVSGAERIDLLLPDGDGEGAPMGPAGGKTTHAELIGLAPELDLALLKAKTNLPPVAMAAGGVRQGELVFAFGSPDGLRNSVSMGIVSAVGRQVDPGNAVAYIQTDSAINPGNSGGPLVNASGELVGLNTFIQTRSGGSEGLGFALPVTVLALAYPQLRDYGHIHRGYLGMSLLTITRGLREGLRLNDETGLLVGDVAPGGPAEAAGIESGDVIRSLDGHKVDELSFEQLYRYWYALPPDVQVEVQVSHGAVVRTASLQAVIAPHDCERPSTLDALDDQIVEPLALFGMGIDEGGGGVMVSARIAGPAVGDVDLQSGDVIKAVNRTPVSTVASLRDAIAAVPHGHTAVLKVERNGALTYVEVDR